MTFNLEDGNLTVNQKVGKALYLRGYFVGVEEDFIYVSKGNHKRDFFDIEKILSSLEIEYKVNNESIIVTNNTVSKDHLDQIIWHRARNHETQSLPRYRLKYKNFIRRVHGPKIRTVTLETGLALLVKSISKVGIVTEMSCDGHGKRAPKIFFAGIYSAIWFDIILQELVKEERFHYNWKVVFNERTQSLTVITTEKGKWDLNLILEDSYKLASFILNNSELLIKLKKELYGRNFRPTRRIISKFDDKQVEEWMKGKFEKFKNEDFMLTNLKNNQ